MTAFVGAFNSAQNSCFKISANSLCRMEQHLPEFPEEKTTSRGIPKFLKISYQEFLFYIIFLTEFQNFRLNISHFGDSKIFGFSENFSRKFPYHLPAFRKVPEIVVEWKNAQCFCTTMHCIIVIIPINYIYARICRVALLLISSTIARVSVSSLRRIRRIQSSLSESYLLHECTL